MRNTVTFTVRRAGVKLAILLTCNFVGVLCSLYETFYPAPWVCIAITGLFGVNIGVVGLFLSAIYRLNDEYELMLDFKNAYEKTKNSPHHPP